MALTGIPWHFFYEVQGVIEDFNTPHCIVVGDWNLVLDHRLDSYNYMHTINPRARQAVLTLMNDLNMFGAWLVLNPDMKRYTWRQRNPFKQSRLDLFLVLWDFKYNYKCFHKSWLPY